MSLQFTIYDTMLDSVEFEDDETGKHHKYLCEIWVVDDDFFFKANCEAMYRPDVMCSMLTLEQVKERFPQGLKHQEAQFLVVIKKSVFDFGSEYDLENLITHETGHFHLGHGGKSSTDTPGLEEECVKFTGKEIGEANNLFGIRYLVAMKKRESNGLDRGTFITLWCADHRTTTSKKIRKKSERGLPCSMITCGSEANFREVMP